MTLGTWDTGFYVALVKGVEEANLDVSGGGEGPRVRGEDTTTSMTRNYHTMVLEENVYATMHMVANSGTGGAYRPFDQDLKSGRPIIDMFHEKHPNSHVPSDENFDAHTGAPDCLELLLVYCFEEFVVAKEAARLSGSAGPCGVEADMLKNWLL